MSLKSKINSIIRVESEDCEISCLITLFKGKMFIYK